MIHPKGDVPDWVLQIMQNAEEYLGLREWRIEVNLDDSPNDDRNNRGVTYLNSTYRNAWITFNREEFLEETDVAKECILHELLHVALGLYDQAFRLVLDLYIDEKYHTNVRKILREGEEPTVVLLSRSLLQYIKH